MAGVTSPRELAAELHVHPSAVRAWLRRQGLQPDGGRWLLVPDVADRVRAYYTAEVRARPGERGVCVVEGCERRCESRAGWCQMHWQRWRRTGSPGEGRRPRGEQPPQDPLSEGPPVHAREHLPIFGRSAPLPAVRERPHEA